MKTRVNKSGLQVDALLANFIDTEAIVGTGVDSTTFWEGFAGLVNSLGPKNSELLQIRHDLQKKIDEWHLKTRSQPFSFNAYKEYLLDIGYLVPKGDPFKIDTENVDLEFSDDGIDTIANIASEVNATVENIGARRLHTIIEKILDEISFTATDRSGEKIVINKEYIDKNLDNLVKDTDLSKFIL